MPNKQNYPINQKGEVPIPDADFDDYFDNSDISDIINNLPEDLE